MIHKIRKLFRNLIIQILLFIIPFSVFEFIDKQLYNLNPYCFSAYDISRILRLPIWLSKYLCEDAVYKGQFVKLKSFGVQTYSLNK